MKQRKVRTAKAYLNNKREDAIQKLDLAFGNRTRSL